MLKNTAGQKVLVYVKDNYSMAVTGDAANITAWISKDGAAPVQSNNVNPTELDSVNMPGMYAFDITQSESNCDDFVLYAQSSTDDVFIDFVKQNTNNTADSLFSLETVVAASPTPLSTSFALSAGSIVDNAYANMIVTIVGTTTETRRIASYNGITKLITLDTGLSFTPEAGNVIRLSGVSYGSVSIHPLPHGIFGF
jgi:hypothetical protein